jgi:uncharacterized membrane protein
MLPALDVGALLLAFLITLVEMTEVVALVFVLGAEGGATRPAALGAVAGTATVALAALLSGAALLALPRSWLLVAASGTLLAFGGFLLRSTLRTYRRQRAGTSTAPSDRPTSLPFAGGYAVGAVEGLETVIVLLALAAGGNGASAVVGALAGGALLVGLALPFHERVRRVKVPTLKLAATSFLFAYGLFWAIEASGRAWPGPSWASDVWLLPLIGLFALATRGAIALDARNGAPSGAKV